MKKTANTQLRIAIVIDDFYPVSGGIARSVQTQLNEFVRLGHHVTLIAPKHHMQKPDNCEIVIVPSYYLPHTPSYMCILRHSQRIAKQITTRHQFDIIHSQTERGGLILAARLAKLQCIPHIHTFHTNLAGTHETNPFASFWGSMAYLLLINPSIALTSKKRFHDNVIIPKASSDATSFFARFDWHSLATIASRVDAYATPALFMKRRIDECSTGLNLQGHIVPTGVNPLFVKAIAQTKRTRTDSTVRFLCVARLSKEKRVDIALQAFIKANIPDSRLDIVGSGDQLMALKKLAKTRSNIFFHNHVNDIYQLAEYYINADVFVMPSYRFDTQAIVLSEAAVAGLPIIYCDDRLDVGVDPDNSLLTKSPDARGIAACMKQLITAKTRQDMSTASKHKARQLQPETMAKQYLALYQQLIHKY